MFCLYLCGGGSSDAALTERLQRREDAFGEEGGLKRENSESVALGKAVEIPCMLLSPDMGFFVV